MSPSVSCRVRISSPGRMSSSSLPGEERIIVERGIGILHEEELVPKENLDSHSEEELDF